MDAIIGRKLGMTRLFEDDGRVIPVTVIEAGPCPGVAVRTPDADGYEAVPLAWEPVAGRKIPQPARGPPAQAGGARAYPPLLAFRGPVATAGDGASLAGLTEADVRRIVREELAQAQKRDAAAKKAAIIASKGTLDFAYPPLILATTAAASGMETHVFFTFYGLNIIRKDFERKLKVTGA